MQDNVRNPRLQSGSINPNARKWVEALKSGKYEQGQRALCRNDRYCPLGVACEVARQNGIPMEIVEEFNVIGQRLEKQVRYDREISYLPKAVQDWLGLQSKNGQYFDGPALCSLVADNDFYCLTFAEIADIIESEPKGLFIT